MFRKITTKSLIFILGLSASNIAGAEEFSKGSANFLVSNQNALKNGDSEALANNLKSTLINQNVNSYLNNSLREHRTEIDLGYDSETNTFLPSILTLQPIKNHSNGSLFFQGRLTTDYSKDREDDDISKTEITTNAGFGYRHLFFDKSLMLGANAFYDRNWSWEHERVGYGIEAKYANFDLNSNYYQATSNEMVRGDITQRAMSGYDYEIITALPYLPWFQVGYKEYKWFSEFLPEDIKGNKITAIITPTPRFIIEASINNGTSAGFDVIEEKTIKLRYQIAFGYKEKSPVKLVDDKFFRPRDMSNHLTDIVRREDRIITEGKDKKNGLFNIVRVN